MASVSSIDVVSIEHSVFIRHAEPLIEPDRPSSMWSLSPQGRIESRRLGESLTSQNVQRIFTSSEKKAHETALIISEELDVEVVVDKRLREVDRPWIHQRFSNAVIEYLRGVSVDGWEPASQVIERFTAALTDHLPKGPSAIVTHGTALSCFLGSRALAKADTFWENLVMPDAWRLTRDGLVRLSYQS